ncbi:MAG: cytochrome c [Saprospiraceae bacterium]|nr:cytochrome c [Saprospiraceae bacterium]
MKNTNYFSLKNVGFLFTFFAASLLIAISSCDSKPPKNSRVAQAAKGKVHFQKYCSQCHGADGTGIIVDTMGLQPANLTKIRASRKSDEFPILEIANKIDGRKMAKAHGSRDMPIWGEVFSEQEFMSEKEIKGKLGELIAYLMSIQV